MVRDRRGNATVYVYDDNGNILVETNALGETVTRSYDQNGNELSRTNHLGETTSWTYDERGNQLSETDPLGNVTTSSYSDRNQLLTQTDALGRVVLTNTYSGRYGENLDSMTDGLNHTTGFSWVGHDDSCAATRRSGGSSTAPCSSLA